LEAVKSIARDPAWLDGAKGKVVKIVSELLKDLPTQHAYRVVFMRRHIDEIVASQRQMLLRNGKTPTPEEDREVRALSIRHLNEVIDWLAAQPNMKVSYVNYARAGRPESLAALQAFCEVPLDVEAMRRAIDPSLYRNRVPEGT